MLRDHVSEFALIKFRMTEYTQYKSRIWKKGCFDFQNKNSSVYRREKEMKFFRGTPNWNRLNNKVYRIRSPFYKAIERKDAKSGGMIWGTSVGIFWTCLLGVIPLD